jgi:putative cardiolipin synthase
VRVRFLIDDTFTIGEDALLARIARHPNIAVRIYNPFNRRYNSFVLRELLNLGEFHRLDHRMHNKIMVVDNRAAIIGGRNLADEYFGHHPDANFRDMEILTAGPVAVSISAQFDAYWNCGWSFPLDRIVEAKGGNIAPEALIMLLAGADGAMPAEDPAGRQAQWLAMARQAQAGEALLVADAPAHEDPAAAEELPNQLARVLIEWIDRARSELILVSAYLIPTPALEAAVERAEGRGVQVRILTNSLRSNNHTAAHAVYRRHIRRIMNHGADLHEVRARAKDRARYMQVPVDDKKLGLHAKFLLIDEDVSFIGSPNLDPRSLHLNTEIGILVHSRAFNRRLRQALAIDFERRNAWHLQKTDDGRFMWVGDDEVLTAQPSDSGFQRLEDWFLGMLPIEDEM